MKLWHDDIRRPPDDGWVWARTNADAVGYLLTGQVEEASLDHDLGLHDVDPDWYLALTDEAALEVFLAHTGGVTGLGLVRWMVAERRVPPRVRLHSFNPDGVRRMAEVLAPHCDLDTRPFEGTRHVSIRPRRRARAAALHEGLRRPGDADVSYPFNPDWVVAPGETLAAWIRDGGGRVAWVEAFVGKHELAGIITGTLEITPGIAENLEKATSISAHFWLALEHNFRVGLAAGKTWSRA